MVVVVVTVVVTAFTVEVMTLSEFSGVNDVMKHTRTIRTAVQRQSAVQTGQPASQGVYWRERRS